MKQKWLAGVLAFSLMAVTIPVEFIYANSDEKIEEIQEQRQSLASQLESVKSQLADQQAAYNDQLTSLEALKEQGKAKEEYDLLKERYELAEEALKKAVDDFEKSKLDLEHQQEVYQDRILKMSESRVPSKLEILLTSTSIRGFFSHLEFVARVADHDNSILESLKAAVQTALATQRDAKDTLDASEQFLNKAKKDLDDLQAGIGLSEATLLSLQTSISNANAQQNLLLEQDAQLQADLSAAQRQAQEEREARQRAEREAERQRQQAAQTTKPQVETQAPSETDNQNTNEQPVAEKVEEPKADTSADEAEAITEDTGSAPSGSYNMTFPNPYSSMVTSPFGWRSDPFTGSSRFHSGVDLNGSFGSPILAALGGTVITANAPLEGSNYGGSGYGNYVVIQHGNGLLTLYGHLKNVYVSAGQSVSQGQAIGTCGSTGYSTGAHLHFEVIDYNNGPASTSYKVDPLPYLWG